MSLEQEIQYANTLSSREEIDAAIADIVTTGWANLKYQLGVLILRRLSFTPEAEKEAFYTNLQTQYDISRTTLSECKTVAATYSAEEWNYYVVESKLTFSHLYLAASRIEDPDQRRRLLQQAIDENLSCAKFKSLLNEIAPPDNANASTPVRLIHLKGLLEVHQTASGENDLVIRTEEDEQSLSIIFQNLIGKNVEISVRYTEE